MLAEHLHIGGDAAGAGLRSLGAGDAVEDGSGACLRAIRSHVPGELPWCLASHASQAPAAGKDSTGSTSVMPASQPRRLAGRPG